MAKRSYPQPKVRAYTSAAGTRWWRAEWHVRRPGQRPEHRVETWPARQYSKTDAQEALDAILARERGATARPDGRTTLAQYWEKTYWPIKQAHLAANSRAQYESAWRVHLKPLHDLTLDSISRHDVERMLVGMASAGMSRSTCDVVRGVIRGVLIDAQDEGLIQRNPMRLVRTPSTARQKAPTRSLTAAEAQHLLESISASDRLFWGLLAGTGMRISEVYGLHSKDLLPDGRLNVERQSLSSGISPLKNRKPRTVRVPTRLQPELRAVASMGGWLFPSSTGTPQTRHSRACRQKLEDAQKQSGIGDLSYRMMRTTFATLYQGDIADVRDTLGHHSEAFTVENYRRSVEERRQAGADALDALISPAPGQNRPN